MVSEAAKEWYRGWMVTQKGGPGSGNYGHAGRRGMRGGSMPRSSAMSLSTGATAGERQQQARQQAQGAVVAQTLEDAQAQQVDRQQVLEHIMGTNPPEQVKSGRMTPEEWADRYMSNGDQEFALVNVHPGAMNLPAGTSRMKVGRYARERGTPPPIVVDSNDKIQARYTESGEAASRLSRGYGRQPHTVIDGKHRVEAALQRGQGSIRAYVPKGKLGQVWQRSHEIERAEYARKYLTGKGYPILEESPMGWTVDRQGQRRTYTSRDIERIAANTGHGWQWGQ